MRKVRNMHFCCKRCVCIEFWKKCCFRMFLRGLVLCTVAWFACFAFRTFLDTGKTFCYQTLHVCIFCPVASECNWANKQVVLQVCTMLFFSVVIFGAYLDFLGISAPM